MVQRELLCVVQPATSARGASAPRPIRRFHRRGRRGLAGGGALRASQPGTGGAFEARQSGPRRRACGAGPRSLSGTDSPTSAHAAGASLELVSGVCRLSAGVGLGLAGALGALVRRQESGGATGGAEGLHRRGVATRRGGIALEAGGGRPGAGQPRLCATSPARGTGQRAGATNSAEPAEGRDMGADRGGSGARQGGELGGVCESSRGLVAGRSLVARQASWATEVNRAGAVGRRT